MSQNNFDFSTIPNTLDVSLYGNVEQVTDTLSKCRVRIFYIGMNRNRTYISEDFAKQLISSLPYAPVKGIFNKDSLDYEDHGQDNTDGRIYGIVAADPNFAWEKHTDDDGVTREYACADVLLFTGLYPEANLIPSKSQSMEIYRKTLKGEWRISGDDNQPFFYFQSGCLVGLQALGDEVEPCFEGAAFYSLVNELKEVVAYYQNFTKKEEKAKMSIDKALFRISDDEKADMLFDLINPNFNENGGWELNGLITKVYDDYALCVNKNGYQRAYYTKNNDDIVLGEIVPVKIVDVTESEYTALEGMKSDYESYEALRNDFTETKEKVQALAAENAEFKTKEQEYEKTISEDEGKIEEFTSKINAYEAEKVELNKKINDITNENQTLLEFKKSIEKDQKISILSKYEEHLTDATISMLKEKMDEYSVTDFKKEVCTAAVESDETIFNKSSEPELVFKNKASDLEPESGVLKLLNKYKNGGSN